uniref:Uncharacterized protein n=1 Tax=Trieres chinensis TaxID=1514140 RepID=A0A7S2EPY0_TRICV
MRGLSTESAGLPPWERDFFRQLMLHESSKGLVNSSMGTNEREVSNGPISDLAVESAIAAAAGAAGVPQLARSGPGIPSHNGHEAANREMTATAPLPPPHLSPSPSDGSLSSGSDSETQQQRF